MQEVNKMSVNYEDLKQEIRRAYMVLGEQAEMQNDMDIDQWLKDGMISVPERDSLKRYNRNLLKECRQ